MRQCMWKCSGNSRLCFTWEELLGLLLISHPEQRKKRYWRQASSHVNVEPIFKSDLLHCHPSLRKSLVCVLTTLRQYEIMLWTISSYLPGECLKWRFISFPREFARMSRKEVEIMIWVLYVHGWELYDSECVF